MSNVATRMTRPEAVEIAKAFVELIEPYTDRLIVAGSLRRRLAMIGDIEIVCVPKVETLPIGFPDMFGEQATGEVDYLDATMTMLLDKGWVTKRLDTNGSPRWGPRTKYLLFQGARVDLFTSPADRFGWTLLLRTGPEQFCRQLVLPVRNDQGKRQLTSDRRPGLMPEHIRAKSGLIYRTSGERIETPEEADIFKLFGLDYQEPWERE